MKFKFVAVLISLVTFATGCGGDALIIPQADEPQTGVFFSTPISGLQYATETQSGTTNTNGEYQYLADESITFSIGDIDFPEVSALPDLTPLDIFETEDVNATPVINMLRLLQSLDVDGNSENGIEISELTHQLASGLSLDFTDSNFDSMVEALISGSGGEHTRLLSSNELDILGFTPVEIPVEPNPTIIGSTDFSDNDDWDLNSSNNTDNVALALDGRDNTRWTTGEDQEDGQFFEINFNSYKTFSQIELNAGSDNDYPRSYEIQVSNDGETFTSVESGRPTDTEITHITFDEQTAQYLRIVQTGESDGFWWSIHELGIGADEITFVTPVVTINELPEDAHPDIVFIADIPESTLTPRANWKDSYSVGDRCYCDTTFDHAIGPVRVETAIGTLTVREACDMIGPGPGSNGNPVYNDIQCGNGPANDAADETICPGRSDIGREGCSHIGPTWNFN